MERSNFRKETAPAKNHAIWMLNMCLKQAEANKHIPFSSQARSLGLVGLASPAF